MDKITTHEAEWMVRMVQEGIDAGEAGTAVPDTARGIVFHFLLQADVVVSDA